MSHSKHGHSHHGQSSQPKQGLHRDWRIWVGVVLMLAAMAMYVLSDNESLVPGGDGQPVPVDAAPAAE